MQRRWSPRALAGGTTRHPKPVLLCAATVLLVALSGCSGAGSSQEDPEEIGQAVNSASIETSTVQPTPFSLSGPTVTPSPEPRPTDTPAPRPTAAEPASELKGAIDELLATEEGVYGVVVLNANGEYQYARNGDVPFVAASLYKLVLLAEIYAMIDEGQIAIGDVLTLDPEYFESEFDEEDGFYLSSDVGGDTTVEQALFGMGAYSSNVAAKALLDLTSLANLRSRAESLGMHDTHFNISPSELPDWPDRFMDNANPDAALGVEFVDTQATYGPVNITTPNDVAQFWLGLLNGQIVSPEASASMLEILRQQVVTDRIPWLLPEGVATANKTGNLYHVVHDTGLIFDPDGTLVLAVLSEGEPDDDHGRQVIQRIALLSTGETDIPPFTETATSPPPG